MIETPKTPHLLKNKHFKKKIWAQITPISKHNNKISEHKKKKDTKVHFVGVGHKYPNTKNYGQTFDH